MGVFLNVPNLGAVVTLFDGDRLLCVFMMFFPHNPVFFSDHDPYCFEHVSLYRQMHSNQSMIFSVLHISLMLLSSPAMIPFIVQICTRPMSCFGGVNER